MDEKAKDIASKDQRLAPLTASARPSENGPWWMMRNSSGKKDVAMTLMIIAFFFSLGLAAIGSIQSLSFAGYAFAFRAFDMGFATTVLVPLIGLYFGRRWTDTQRGLYDTQALYSDREHVVVPHPGNASVAPAKTEKSSGGYDEVP
jgi:hypothetical protein